MKFTSPRIPRSSLEILESRIAPAVVFAQGDFNGDGTVDVRITGGGGAERIVIVDSNAQATISIDANNDGDFTDPSDRNAVGTGVPIETFEISLAGGNDSINFSVSGGGYSNAEKSLFINLGAGSNSFVFSQGVITNGSDLRIDIQGGPQNDAIDIELNTGTNDIANSRVTITGNLGAGRDAILDATGQIIGPSVLKFGNNGDIDNASVHVDLDLGTGSNLFETLFRDDQNLSDNVPASVDILITGSPLAIDSDFVRLDMTNAGPSGPATFRYRADLGAGNDEFFANVPTSFNVFNATGDVGGYAGIEALGGAGNDRLSIFTSASGSQNLDGLLDISLQGGDGDDTLTYVSPSMDTSSSSAINRGLRLGMDGGNGRDTLVANISTAAGATMDLDVALHGGFGDDLVQFTGFLNTGTPTFGPAGQILLDGGAGTNVVSNLGDFTVHKVNFANGGLLPATLGLTTGDFDGNGTIDLRFLGLTTAERVLIVDDAGTSVTFSWDRNNDGDFTDAGEINGQVISTNVESFLIDMRGGNDTVEIQIPSGYSNADRFFSIALGDGNNRLIVPATATSVTNASDVRFEVQGGKQNDSIDVSFGTAPPSSITSSRVQFQLALGGGRDGLTNTAGVITGPSQIDFADNGDFNNSSIRIAADLGAGSNFFRAGINNDIIQGATGNVVDVSILGSTLPKDKDDILVDLTFSSVGTASYLNVFAGLGAGNDRFTLAALTTGSVPFQTSNGGSDNSGGIAFVSVSGGLGNDTLRLDAGTGTNNIPLDGLFDVVFSGGAGNDILDFNYLAGGAQLTTSNGTGFLRGLRLWLEGGTGNDTIGASLTNTATATFAYDLILRGGLGIDKITLTLTNNGGAVTFGPSGSILTEKGPGADIITNTITGAASVNT